MKKSSNMRSIHLLFQRLSVTLAPTVRRTARLDSIVQRLGLALGGRPATGFAKRLMLPISKDTLLHVVDVTAVRRPISQGHRHR